MSTHKHINIICCVVLSVTLLLTVLLMNAGNVGVQIVSAAPGYVGKLFDTNTVHTIDIIMENWDDFVTNCRNEEYMSHNKAHKTCVCINMLVLLIYIFQIKPNVAHQAEYEA